MELRDYQLECIQKAKTENLIINLETGKGKTLIAVRVIDHFVQKQPKLKVMFLVPTRVLVEQQANYYRNHKNVPASVVELSGNQMEGWTGDDWESCMKSNNVLVGTPDVLRRALVNHAFILMSEFSLLVFDECHNATGNSPMAAIMRDSFWKLVQSQVATPRVLGLTASFVNGSLKNIESKRQSLEVLLMAKLFSPDVSNALDSGDFPELSTEFHQVKFAQDSISACIETVEGYVKQILDGFKISAVRVSEPKRIVARATLVFKELGRSGFHFFLREGVIFQLQGHLEEMEARNNDDDCQRIAHSMKIAIPTLQNTLTWFADALEHDPDMSAAKITSSKCDTLFDLLEKLFLQKENSSAFKGIVFVEQIALTYPLTYLINRHFGKEPAIDLIAKPCSGSGSMTDSVRKEALDAFKTGSCHLLVCTAALEEGVDVSDCSFVIRFSGFHTTKSHIQGSGRARQVNAKVYYFENDPEQEHKGAQHLNAVARDTSLELSFQQKRSLATSNQVAGLCPYFDPKSRAEVNMYNCVQIVYEYMSKVMGQSINPEELMVIDSQVVRDYPYEVRKFIKSVTYPCPTGMVEVSLDEVNRYWGDVKLEQVLDADRVQNADAFDLERRRFLFVVAVELHKHGHLSSTNQPSANAVANTKQAIGEVIPMASKVSVSNGFHPTCLDQNRPRSCAKNASGASKPQYTACLRAGTNFKSLLNEKANIIWRLPAAQTITYDCTKVGGQDHLPQFRCTVTLVQLAKSFQGQDAPNKKEAEQSAAEVALQFLHDMT